MAVLNFAWVALLLAAVPPLAARALDEQPDLLLVVVLAVGLAATGGLGGYGLLKLRPFGWKLQSLLAGLGLLLFPLGTLFAVPILIYLFQPGVRILYAGRSPAELTPQQAQCLERTGPPRRAATLVATAATLAALLGGSAVTLVIARSYVVEPRSRVKQKSTLAKMSTVMAALEQFAEDHGSYPASMPMEQLAGQLAPTYVGGLPQQDGWKHPLVYLSWQESPLAPGPDRYTLASPGADGRWEHTDVRAYRPGTTEDEDADILGGNGSFIRHPKGLQPPSTER
jgi:hypothetical protein